MSAVLELRSPQSSMLQEDQSITIDDAELQRAAKIVFDEMVDSGCSMADCLMAVYVAGMDRITGVRPIKRVKKPAIPPCPYDGIVALYHEHLAALPGVSVMNAARKKALRSFWTWIFESKKADGSRRATTAEEGLHWVGLYFTRATENHFLMGRTKRSEEHRGWVPDIDYVVSSSGMKQIIEKTGAQA